MPVAIKNTDRMMGKRTGVAYAGEIEMVLLPPVETDGKTSDDLMDLLIEVRASIAAELARGA